VAALKYLPDCIDVTHPSNQVERLSRLVAAHIMRNMVEGLPIQKDLPLLRLDGGALTSILNNPDMDVSSLLESSVARFETVETPGTSALVPYADRATSPTPKTLGSRNEHLALPGLPGPRSEEEQPMDRNTMFNIIRAVYRPSARGTPTKKNGKNVLADPSSLTISNIPSRDVAPRTPRIEKRTTTVSKESPSKRHKTAMD
jgi:hypothetical protein